MVNKPSRKEIISKQFGRAPRNISMTEFRALKINFLGIRAYFPNCGTHTNKPKNPHQAEFSRAAKA